MAVTFTNNFTNSGQITTASTFAESSTASKNDLANQILNQLGGNKDTGFDFQTIVNLSVQQKMGTRIEDLKSSITNTNIRTNSLSSLMNDFSTFDSDIIDAISQSGSLSGLSANSSNASAVDVSISSIDTVNANTALNVGVKSLAQAQSMKSEGVVDRGSAIGEGLMTISLGKYSDDGSFSSNGTGGDVVVRVVEGMTLSDVAAEINSGGGDVQASVVTNDDGTSSLALFSQVSGKSNSLKVSVSAEDNGYNDGLLSLAYSKGDTNGYQVPTEASDAVYTVNGIEFSSDTNSVKGVFGYDFTLKDTTSVDAKITASSNSDGVSSNIQAFIYEYNTLINSFNSLQDDVSGEDGVGSLYGEDIATDIGTALTSLRKTLGASIDLNSLGITFNSDHTLSLDTGSLSTALANDPNAVLSAFSDTLKSTNPDFSVRSYGNDASSSLEGYTQDGTYSVEVTQAATSATLSGASIGDSVVFEEDTPLTMRVNGTSVSVAIEPGTYTTDSLAAILSSSIKNQTGKSISVVNDGGSLTLTTGSQGSSQSISFESGASALGFDDGSSATGTDVAGRINGIVAMGDGTTLTSIISGDAKGLAIDVGGSAVGSTGYVTVGRGFNSHLTSSVTRIAGEDGLIQKALESYKEMIDSSNPDSYITQLDDAEERESNLTAKYNAQYSYSQARLSAMQNNLETIEALFFSNDSD